MNKKLSFFESIYLNKNNKELLTKNSNITTQNAQNNVDDNLTLGVFVDSKNSDLNISDTKELNTLDITSPDVKVDLNKPPSDVETPVSLLKTNDTSDLTKNEDLTENVQKIGILEDTSVPLTNDLIVDELNSSTLPNEDTITSNPPLEEPIKKAKKRKKKKKPNNSTDIATNNTIEKTKEHDDNITNLSGTLEIKPTNTSENKNIQSNIEGISEILNRVTENSSNLSLNAKENVNLKVKDVKKEDVKIQNSNLQDLDDLFLRIEIPTDELSELDINDPNEFDDLDSLDNSDNTIDFDVNVSNSINILGDIEDVLKNESNGVIHFDLDDQLSDLDIKGGVEEDLFASKISNKLEDELTNPLDELVSSERTSEYDPKYKNSFADDVLDSSITVDNTSKDTQNTSFALLDALDTDEDSGKQQNDDADTKINIPML